MKLSAAPASAVDPAKTWLLLSYKLDSSNITAAEALFRGRIAAPHALPRIEEQASAMLIEPSGKLMGSIAHASPV